MHAKHIYLYSYESPEPTPPERKKDHSNRITRCEDINDQSQKLKINILNVIIQQLVIQFMRYLVYG
jgi:hypothetical protein